MCLLHPRRLLLRKNLGLYLIVDPIICGGHQSTLDLVSRVIPFGIDVIQLRAPEWHKRAIFHLATDLLTLTRPKSIPLLINDHVDVAMASGADGVHVGQRDLPPEIVRKQLGQESIIGFSVTDETQLELARSYGDTIDYIGVGPVFATSTKPDHATPIGIEGLHFLCSRSIQPTVAIGGINPENAFDVMQQGRPDGLAVISAICSAPDPEVATRSLREAIERARNY